MSFPKCPHCHSDAPSVRCERCQRQMCQDCISQDTSGLYNYVCGLCLDEMRIAAENFIKKHS